MPQMKLVIQLSRACSILGSSGGMNGWLEELMAWDTCQTISAGAEVHARECLEVGHMTTTVRRAYTA